MVKTLIVDFDYSKEANSATDFAIRSAKEIGARVVLFHLHNLSMDMINSTSAISKLEIPVLAMPYGTEYKGVKQIEAGMLIMVPQKHGFWASMVHRSKT